ncbi:MAG: glycosyltransferase family 4 protein [Alphaproteobacteria bacterium]|nr:glycosyltransferase family 4 protein [Alphaproteobacteria bacterium]
MFERETALYRRLSGRGVRIGFLTYGGSEELSFASRLPDISIYPNHFGLSPRRYERLLPLLHAKAFWQADIVKTNQVSSVYAAMPGARLWRRPLIARQGFLPSDFAARQHGAGSVQHLQEDQLERRLFDRAHSITVTTQAMAEDIARRMPRHERVIQIVPNYVDTDMFAPNAAVLPEYDVLFVGRLTEQKNIPSLLKALSTTRAKALLIGNGPQAELVKSAVSESQGRIDWLPTVPNGDLPALMARSRLFVLPSLWEGHPKTLLEAMACGMAVIGAKSPGIQSEIEHGRTGWLCPPEPLAMAEAITHLLESGDLRNALGSQARLRILSDCSLDRVVELELDIYQQLLKAPA